eukprot:925517_1
MKTFYFLLFHIALALTEVIYYEYLSDIHNTGWECTGTCTSPNGNGVTGLSGGSYAVKTFDISDYRNLSITYQMNKGYCTSTCLVEYQYNTHNLVWTVIGFFGAYSTFKTKPILPTWPGQTTSISIKLNAPNSCAFTRIGLNGTKVTTAPTHNPTIDPTVNPTIFPSDVPSIHPTHNPSTSPSHTPSTAPSYPPTNHPSSAPSKVPSSAPSQPPSAHPTLHPTIAPSISPTYLPSNAPTHA